MCVADSLELGWPDILARAYDEAAAAETFTDPATPDLFLCINLRGTGEVECKRPSGWSVAQYRPGTLAVTSPGNTSTLRWRAAPDNPLRSLHVHLAAPLLASTAEAMGVADLPARLPDSLQFEDELVLAAGHALYAQSVAQTWLRT